MKYAIGIDLGGTNIRCGVIDDCHKIIASQRCATLASQGFEGVVHSIAQLVNNTLQETGLTKNDIIGIGVASAGRINGDSGVVLEATNLNWYNVNICESLQQRCGIAVILENDANAAAYGEYIAGAGQGTSNMLMMTLGTGVGGACVFNGKLFRGSCWTAGELGHVIISENGRACGCGNKGCIEAYCSTTATVNRFREDLRKGYPSTLSSLSPDEITCKQIFEAAQKGDVLAKNIVQRTAYYIALAAANMEALLNPDKLVIGGGMMLAGEYFLNIIRKEYNKFQKNMAISHMQIVAAELGDDAGIVGAAAEVFNETNITII